MMRVLSLLLVASVPALARSPVDRCKDAWADCKEDCTIEFGTSVHTRGGLADCMERCTARRADCEERALLPGAPDEPGGRTTPAAPGGIPSPEPLPERAPRTSLPPEREPNSPPPAARPAPSAAPPMDRADDHKLRVEPRRSRSRPEREEAAATEATTGTEPSIPPAGDAPPEVRRTATRASDLPGGAPPTPEPAPPPPPASAPKPGPASTSPKPPPQAAPAKKPEPAKKRALDEWDPDAL